MGRREVRDLLTPMNGRIVGCQGKVCVYTANFVFRIAKYFAKSVKKLLTIVV